LVIYESYTKMDGQQNIKITAVLPEAVRQRT